MEIRYYLRRKMHEFNLTPKQTAELAGVGIRFVYEMLAGKPTLRMDKVNDVLRIFDAELGFEYLPEVRKAMNKKKSDSIFRNEIIPDQEEKTDFSDSDADFEQEYFSESVPDYITGRDE